jgi:predicted DsbA family dithiol-disulfide isomerase
VTKQTPVHIEIVFDPACPWCFIGKRRLEQALQLRPMIKPIIQWHPFLLNPELPSGGHDNTAYLVRKFGSEGRVRRAFGAISVAGLSVEIDFAFDRIRNTPNTLDAHRLARFADVHGRSSEIVEALFHNYFVYGRDIGDVEILIEIAEELGLPSKEVRTYLESDADVALIYEENARAHSLGVNGVPSYLFSGGLTISGAQEAEVLARILDAALLMETAA